MTALTIGMTTYNDYEGVYFTVQALRSYQELDDVEFLVVDHFGCQRTKSFVEDRGTDAMHLQRTRLVQRRQKTLSFRRPRAAQFSASTRTCSSVRAWCRA